jgi:hypothetical protein
MNRKVNLSLALAAGLFGGCLSRFLTPFPVLAQTETPKEMRAQSLVLVDEKNHVVWTLKPTESTGPTPAVVLLDWRGREIWRAGIFAKRRCEGK